MEDESAESAESNEGEFATWTRAELIAALRKAGAANGEAAAGSVGVGGMVKPRAPRKKHDTDRPFDHDRHATRKIALKIAYFGWPYAGLASQENTEETIEGYLFKALIRAKLIRDRVSSLYTRCGRTDRGVSAFSQVVALTVRSKLPDGTAGTEGEFNYSGILNRLMPPNIRVIGWTPVDAAFNARFGCLQRTYKYFFERGNRDISRMQEAARSFEGLHDFRNFCRWDRSKGAEQNFMRHIYRFEIQPAGLPTLDPTRQMFVAVITGKAFLWHQIRCMMTVLFAVGDGNEDPSIVPTLLDVQRMPLKPQYDLASELPLVLFDCGFEDAHFIGDPEEQTKLCTHVRTLWLERQIMATLSDELLAILLGGYVPTASVHYPAPAPASGAVVPRYLRWSEAQALEPVVPFASRGRRWQPLLERRLEQLPDGWDARMAQRPDAVDAMEADGDEDDDEEGGYDE